MRIVRNLCLYLHRTDPGCFVPDPSGFPAPHPPQRPHIFTEEQIVRLLRIATDLAPASTSPLRAEVYRLAIVLLYTVGLRRGELVRLVISDYDAAEHTLLVRASKFHKSRLVALSQDGAREMDRYLRARRCLWHHANAPLLVSSHGGLQPYTGASIRMGLCALFRAADVRTVKGHLPRVHDLRHYPARRIIPHGRTECARTGGALLRARTRRGIIRASPGRRGVRRRGGSALDQAPRGRCGRGPVPSVACRRAGTSGWSRSTRARARER